MVMTGLAMNGRDNPEENCTSFFAVDCPASARASSDGISRLVLFESPFAPSEPSPRLSLFDLAIRAPHQALQRQAAALGLRWI
jgi:hypothetical protein